jgi:DNA-binding CsgD family transcriptional regulator
LLARPARRSTDAQTVARAGAVIGRCFVPDVLAGIMDVAPASLDAPIQELIDHGVLTPIGPQGLVDFRHQLLRDAIYRSVTLQDRRRYHARAAEFGAALEGHSEIHASAHYERAGLRRPAFEAAQVGARDASRLFAHREAFELYRRAVDNVPEDLPDGERSHLYEAFAHEAAAIEQNDLAEQMFRAARDASLRAGERARAAELVSGIVTIWRREARPVGERRALIEAAIAEVDALPPSQEVDATRIWLTLDLAICQLDAQEPAACRETMSRHRDWLEQAGHHGALIGVDTQFAMLDILGGDVDGGLTRIASLAARGQEAGEEWAGVTAYRSGATWAVRTLRYDRARTFLDDGLRYADSIEQSHCAHVMRASRAMVAWAGADWVEAMSEAGQAIADHGCRRAAEMARWSIGYVALGRGDLTRAGATLADGLAFGKTTETIEMVLPPMWGLAETHLLAGEPESAAALCRDAFDRARHVGEKSLLIPFVVTGVRAEQGAGQPAAAETWVADCSGVLAETGVAGTAALDHARGLIALAAGATGIARAALESAVRGWAETGRVWEGAWARLDLAARHIRSHRFADAVAIAAAVRTLASRIDSQPLADRADALTRQARGRVVLDEPWRPLTVREYNVARLVSEGLTNAEIADQLGIAPKTASSHVEHILAKLGASRRAEIASWASNIERSPVAR